MKKSKKLTFIKWYRHLKKIKKLEKFEDMMFKECWAKEPQIIVVFEK